MTVTVNRRLHTKRATAAWMTAALLLATLAALFAPVAPAGATATTPATTTPVGGSQPGTVAPATTTPTSSTTPATTPTIVTPTHTPTVGSTVVVGAARRTRPTGTQLSTGALVLIVCGALLVLGCLAWALGRWLALEPRWTVSLMYSLREASYRASATWAEFSDWLRLGH